MKNFFLMVMLMCLGVLNVNAQEIEGKPVVYIDFFNAPDINEAYVEALRNKVIEGIQKMNRVEVRDVASSEQLKEEEERRKQASAMSDATARTQQMKTLGAHYIITADVTQMTADKKTDSAGKVYYSGNIRWTIKVIDAANGTLKITKSYDHSGIASNSGETPEKAIVATCDYARSGMSEFVDDNFPMKGLILKVETTNKKNTKAETVYIDLGTAKGVVKGQKFSVFIETDIAGEIAETEIGALTAKEVLSPKRTLCKVTKGEEEVLKAMNNGQKLTIKSRKANTVLTGMDKLLDSI